jgi:hypothetical protein
MFELVCRYTFNIGEDYLKTKRTQQCVHADGWIHTAKLALFVALSFVRFVSESRPASRR